MTWKYAKEYRQFQKDMHITHLGKRHHTAYALMEELSQTTNTQRAYELFCSVVWAAMKLDGITVEKAQNRARDNFRFGINWWFPEEKKRLWSMCTDFIESKENIHE